MKEEKTAPQNVQNGQDAVNGSTNGEGQPVDPGRNAAEKDASSQQEAPREKLSIVGRIACFWPLGVIPPICIWLWLKYVITARQGFLSYIPILSAIIVAFLLNSLFTLWFYHEDKKLAEQQRRRIPEFFLHLWELICGWPGALIAQKKFHHKYRKLSYMIVFWLYVVLNLLIVFCVIFPGPAKSIVEALVRRTPQEETVPGKNDTDEKAGTNDTAAGKTGTDEKAPDKTGADGSASSGEAGSGQNASSASPAGN